MKLKNQKSIFKLNIILKELDGKICIAIYEHILGNTQR